MTRKSARWFPAGAGCIHAVANQKVSRLDPKLQMLGCVQRHASTEIGGKCRITGGELAFERGRCDCDTHRRSERRKPQDTCVRARKHVDKAASHAVSRAGQAKRARL